MLLTIERILFGSEKGAIARQSGRDNLSGLVQSSVALISLGTSYAYFRSVLPGMTLVN